MEFLVIFVAALIISSLIALQSHRTRRIQKLKTKRHNRLLIRSVQRGLNPRLIH